MTYQLIETTESLNPFCESLKSASWIAIDTEFVRTDTYFAILSLIQIQSESGVAAIIDPLKIDDLSSLWQILTHPNIIKVFHSARQDIEVLYQASGQMPQAIFDTQIAALFLGHGDLAGLSRVVEAELGFTLEKDQTRTNWQKRPLTPQQLNYAYLDVHALAPLYKKLIDNLNQNQLNALQDDFNALLNPSLYDSSPDTAADKIKAVRSLHKKHRAIAYSLAEWRELYAINHNKPKKWVLSDDALVAIAKRPPKTPEALYKVPNIKSSSVKNHGDEWITLIDEVFATPDTWTDAPKKQAPTTPQEEILINIGQALMQQLALDYGISLNNIANKAQLLQILRDPNPILQGWRSLLFESPFRAFISEQISLQYEQGQLIQKTFNPQPD